MDRIYYGWHILVGFIMSIGWFFRHEFNQKSHGKRLDIHDVKLDLIHSIDRRLARIEGRLGIKGEIE